MKKIAVFTGSRAEYGLLYWLMKEIQQSSDLDLQLIVGGMHLSPEFGHTLDFILDDGFEVNERVEMLLSSSTEVGVAKSLGLGIIGFADSLNRLKPDCVVVLGDRFEAFAIAQSAAVMRIPIAHIHGGELTEGLVDEAIRHSISKMSHLHFTSTEEYRNRVIQLGEDPTRVFNVGAPAIENMRRSTLLSSQELEKSLNFILGDSPLLVTYHPVTLEKDGGVASLKSLLRVLDEKVVSHQIVMTFPNSDAHSTELIALLQAFAAKYPTKTLLVKSLGQLRYLSLMKVSRAVVGNSSSGLIEAPAFGVPTVDIGTRQNGRLRLESVIRAEDNFDSINRAVSEALSNEHLALSKTAANPFGDGKTSAKIVSILSLTDFGSILLKKFHDLETPCVSAS